MSSFYKGVLTPVAVFKASSLQLAGDSQIVTSLQSVYVGNGKQKERGGSRQLQTLNTAFSFLKLVLTHMLPSAYVQRNTDVHSEVQLCRKEWEEFGRRSH